MSNRIQTSLIIKKETIYDKIRKSIFTLVFQKEAETIRRLDDLLKPNRPNLRNKIIIPKEMGKDSKIR